jgi:hypothetical protein
MTRAPPSSWPELHRYCKVIEPHLDQTGGAEVTQVMPTDVRQAARRPLLRDSGRRSHRSPVIVVVALLELFATQRVKDKGPGRRGTPSKRVIAVREDFQRVTAQRWQADNVGAHPPQDPRFLSQAHGDPDITMEIFFTDGPIERPSGFRSVRDRANRMLHVQRSDRELRVPDDRAEARVDGPIRSAARAFEPASRMTLGEAPAPSRCRPRWPGSCPAGF